MEASQELPRNEEEMLAAKVAIDRLDQFLASVWTS